jgi:hypothetical protein
MRLVVVLSSRCSEDGGWVAAQAQLGLVPDSAAEAVADVLTDEVLDRSFDLADLAERSEAWDRESSTCWRASRSTSIRAVSRTS